MPENESTEQMTKSASEQLVSSQSETVQSETLADDVPELIERLKKQVQQRRAQGEYPEDLEEQLERHFERIVFHRKKPAVGKLRADIEALDSHMRFSRDRIQTDSTAPGGEIVHKALNKAIARQSEGILSQVQEFADVVRRALHTIGDSIEDSNTHVHSDLLGRIDALVERVRVYETRPDNPNAEIADLRSRLEKLEHAEERRSFNPWFTNDEFENAFRGSETSLADQYRSTVQEFFEGPVIDFGCGRGEFLQLLRERKLDCWGIEIDPELVKIARKDGFRVELGDGIAILGQQGAQTLGGIVLLQVIEHLTIQQQLDLVALAYEKLKPGGRIVVETVNPQSLYVYAHAFYLDPTHTRPVHPAYLTFLFEQAGFSEVKMDWRNPPPAQDILLPIDGDPQSAANQNVERLNRVLFAPGDYALIVTK